MTKKMMFGLAAAAAVVFLVLSVTGFPPDLGSAQGTIGQAKRYTAPQVAAGDAAIGDPAVQQFIQSETFAALLKDKAAMKVLTDPKMREALANQDLIAELRRPDLTEALNALEINGVFRDLAANADLMRFVSGDLAHYVQDAQLMRWLSDPALVNRLAALGAELRNLDANVVSRIGNADLARYLKDNPGLSTALSNEANLHALTSADLRLVALQAPAFVSALRSETFLHALSGASFIQALRGDIMAQALSAPAFASALSSPDFAKAIAAADLR